MKTYCIYIPRDVVNEAIALYQTKWNITNGGLFAQILEELHESINELFSLELLSSEQTVYICFTASGATIDIIAGSIYSMLPGAEIREIEDFTFQIDQDSEIAATDLRLARDDIFPLLAYDKFVFDSLSPLLSALSRFPADETVLIQVVCRAAKDSAWLHFDLLRRQWVDKLRHVFRAKYWFKKGVGSKFTEKIREKCNNKLYRINFRAAVVCPKPAHARDEQQTRDPKAQLAAIVRALSFMNTVDENQLRMGRVRYGQSALKPFQDRYLGRSILLTANELATIWHPPALSVAPNTAQVLAIKGGPPRNLPSRPGDPEISFFAETDYRDRSIPFGLQRFDRRRHLYIVGKSGSGKSCLIQLLVKSDIEHGYGAAVLDPHGDLIDDILCHIPRHRINDVVIFDPTDLEYPASFNPVAQVPHDLHMRVTIGFAEIFKKVFGADWTERMDHILRYSTLSLLATPGTTLLSLQKMLTDDVYRAKLVAKIPDEAIRSFWNVEFEHRKSEFRTAAISPLLNRLGQFLASDLVRNIIGQPLNRFDFRKIMDERKILLLKISKGALGEENGSLLGAMVIAKIFEAAMSRADTHIEDRNDFYFYVDEFHNFATDSFDEILSESRKYRLNLTLAHQFIGQLSPSIQQTIFGNIGNLLSFRVGADDAEVLAREFAPRFKEEDLINLAVRSFYLKMQIKGEVGEALSGRTLPLQFLPEAEQCATACAAHSRKHYALPLQEAQEIIQQHARSLAI